MFKDHDLKKKFNTRRKKTENIKFVIKRKIQS